MKGYLASFVLSLIGVLILSGCDRSLSVEEVYSFHVETLPYYKSLHQGEKGEVKCTLHSDHPVANTTYTIRYFDPNKLSVLYLGEEGLALVPNERYPIDLGSFTLYCKPLRNTGKSDIEVVVEDNHGQSQSFTLSFEWKK